MSKGNIYGGNSGGDYEHIARSLELRRQFHAGMRHAANVIRLPVIPVSRRARKGLAPDWIEDDGRTDKEVSEAIVTLREVRYDPGENSLEKEPGYVLRIAIGSAIIGASLAGTAGAVAFAAVGLVAAYYAHQKLKSATSH